MDDYTLQPNETVLFEGTARFQFPADDSETEFAGQKLKATILLTNLALVLQARKNRLLKPDLVRLVEIPIVELKIYNGQPAVRTAMSGKTDLYFIGQEVHLDFGDAGSARKFTTALTDLVTGTTIVDRSIDKAGAIVYKAATSLIGALGSALGGQKPPESQNPYPNTDSLKMAEQRENLKKIEDLYRSGILTREEYQEKVDQILSSLNS